MIKFGARLRQLRTSRNLSQMDFAKQIGVSKSSINMYERGEREPGLETLEKIADYFNVDMDYLLGKTDIINKIWCSSSFTSSTTADLTAIEQSLIKDFRNLNAEGQQKLVEYAADLCASGRYIKTASDHSVPKQA